MLEEYIVPKKVEIIDYCGSDGISGAGLDIKYNEFALVVKDKNYRFYIDDDCNITFALINGADCEITTHDGLPAIRLIGSEY